MKNIFLTGIALLINLFAFSIPLFAQCPVGEGEVKVVLYTDNFSSTQNAYSVKIDGVVVASGGIGSLTNEQEINLYVGCHAPTSKIELQVTDANGNGLTQYSLALGGEESPDFNIQYKGIPLISGDIIESGGLLTPIGGLSLSCGGTNNLLVVKFYPDSFSDTENAYSIKINGTVVASGAVGSLPDEIGSDYNLYMGCHAPTDIVEIQITDTGGDGVAANDNYNSPDWRMSYGGLPILSGSIIENGGTLTPTGGMPLKENCGVNKVPLYLTIYTDALSDTQNTYSVEVAGTVIASGAIGSLPEDQAFVIDLGCQTIGDNIKITITDTGSGITSQEPDWILHAAGAAALCESSLIASGNVTGSGGVVYNKPIEIPLCGFADCEFKRPLCVDLTTTLIFSSGTARGAANEVVGGVDFGCLGSTEKNSAWYYLQVDPAAPANSTLRFQMVGNLNADYDYIVWGPFTDPNVCGPALGAPKDCSFSFVADETVNLTNVNPNEYYVFMISRYGSTETTHTLVQLAGSTASTSCSIVTNPCTVTLPADYSVCAGETTTLSAEVTPNSASWSYQWYLNGVAITGATFQDYLVPAQLPVANITQTYKVIASNPAFGCTVEDELVLTTTLGDFNLDLGTDISRCDAAGAILLNAGDPSQGAGFIYQWFEDGTSIVGANNATLSVNFTSLGGLPVTRNYKVIVTDPSPTGCSQIDEVDVTFIPNPIVDLGADRVACDAFGIITLNAAQTSHGSTISYQWFENGTAIIGATNATLDVSFPSGGATQTRTYRAEVTDSRGTRCTQADEVNITFKPNLVVNLASLPERCEKVFSFSINASDATHSADMTYELFENGVLSVTSASPIFTISINDEAATTIQTRTYRVRATDNTALGCTTTSNTVSITYNYKPIIAPINDKINIDCRPNELTAQTSNYSVNDNRLKYSWIYSGANNVQLEASTNATVLVNKSGTYTLTITTTLPNGTTCSSVESFVVQCKEEEMPEYVPVLQGQAGYYFVDLQWTTIPAGSNISEFEVYMGMYDEEPNTLVSLTSNNFLKVDLLNGIKYSFRVRAVYVNQGGNNYEVGAYSNTIFLKPSIVLGQDETDKRAAISIFPNPSNGSFTLEFKAIEAQKANLTVVDLTGKVILTQALSDLNNGSQQNIELSGVSSGVYIIQVQTEKGVYQQKITIVK